MARPKILVTRAWPEAVEARLAATFDATLNPGDVILSAADLAKAAQDHDAILPTVTDRIGQALAQRAHHGFGMRVLVQNRSRIAAAVLEQFGATQVDTLDALLPEVDFLSLHCPGGAANRYLIDARRLGLMRRDAYLVNTARGEVVDEAALVAALQSGVIAGAGLDVFEDEPKVHPGLLALENVALLPHVGSATRETRDAMGHRVIDNLEAFFAGRDPPDRVA
jgi:lactate dehydrogenase-like 2-hydroxyacid dehydrogenase